MITNIRLVPTKGHTLIEPQLRYCDCVVLMKNSELYHQGKLPMGAMLCGADTRGYKWGWATCMGCGRQHQVNIERVEL